MNNLKMRTKLGIGFGTILVLMCVMGTVAYLELQTIDKEASFTEHGLIPQSETASKLNSLMRTAGLNIRGYSDTGDPVRLNNVQSALSAIRAELIKADKLSKEQPGLRATPNFLKNFAPHLAAFASACDKAKEEWAQRNAAVAATVEIGPQGTFAVNNLIDIIQAQIVRASEASDHARLEILFKHLKTYNTLFDTNEKLRREGYYALAINSVEALQKNAEAFKEPLNTLAALINEMKNNPEQLKPLQDTEKAFKAYQAAVQQLLESIVAQRKTSTDLIAAFNSALEQVNTLNMATQNRNAAIATSMSANSTKAINNVLLLISIGLVVGIGMTIYLTRNITGNLGRFVAAATDLSAGKFDTRVDIHCSDEIGLAAQGINKAFDVVVDKVLWYESILDAVPSIISVTDMERRWTFVNALAEKALGKTRQELLGHPCSEWKSSHCNSEACGLNCLQKNIQPPNLVMNGTTVSLRATYITNLAGEKVGHIELCSDISELTAAQAKAESALRDGMDAAAQKLESVVHIISSASTQLATQIEQSERGADRAAGRVTETATAMEEMNSVVLAVAKNASSASEVSRNTRIKAENGAKVVRHAVDSIQLVQKNSLELKTDMAALGEHAQSISQIMGVISDIADQTNLLALNAAIEAARAGDAGRGFAVVADEVRKLAEKTMTSTIDVSKAIQTIQESAQQNVQQVDAAVQSIEEAVQLSTESGDALAEIVTMVDDTADQVHSIASASEEQSATSEEINRAITEINSVVGESARTMREANQAISELAEQAQVLSRLIAEMKNAS